MLESLSDSIVNAFTRVRKPDARFVEMNDGLERFEEGMGQIEKLVARSKNREEGRSSCASMALIPQIWPTTTRTWRRGTKAWGTSSRASRSPSTVSRRRCSTFLRISSTR